MAFDKDPLLLFPGLTVTGSTSITIPFAAVKELDPAEVTPGVEADSRKLVYALMERIEAWYTSMATVDRPNKLSVSKSNTVSSDGAITRSVTVRSTLAIPTEIAAEA